MKSVRDTCQPRPEILAGTFNPEVFTASLSPIIEYYHTGRGVIDSIYTNAELFFREATYPTQGLRLTLSEVFGRVAGDMTVPAIHRLETAFGGGKTHTLIACTHIAYRGTELRDIVQNILDPKLLSEPGSVAVVGVAGDEIPVHKPKGNALVPYTLWGEIAYQIGGESLYREVEDEANSYAAPGKTYFERVLGGRKAIIMLDELAQYAARLEAARPDGASQLAAFLMGLHGYARNHPGIAVILTLASATDAFARQTELLAKLIAQVRGEEVSEDDALGIGEKAVRGVASVVARDAVQITPVHAAEISSVLAKRLFLSVNRDAARAAAEEYMQMYRRNANMLPDEAASEDFKGRMIANYPFHPTLVDFLNKKLANAENFQGTRGVLRVLALAVRSLWLKQQDMPMIHDCHLDLRSDRVVNEILGRTGSSDLLLVLNADVGSVDTGALEGGRSNAELADQKNPHPEGHPLYEYTWKTIFLHSLVGREEGLDSKIFGLTEPEALFCVSFPGLTPPQVRTAIEEINESAFYLRYEQGKYFASEEPTINSVLARIRRTLKSDQVNSLLEATARKVVTGKTDLFHIEHDVSLPEHLPDGKGRPVLGVVSLTAESVDVEAVVTTRGVNKPREQQNIIFLLVPETATVKGTNELEKLLQGQAQDARQRIESIARQVEAMRVLIEKPQSYGVNPRRLEDADFRKRKTEREQALLTAVSSIYTGLYYPSTAGHIVRKEIKTAGGEGGLPFIEQIRETLLKDGKLLTSNNTTQADLLNLSKLFFEHGDTVTLEKLRQHFSCVRSWPVLETPGILEQIIRAGVQKGVWCAFRMGAVDSVKPGEFYHRENDIPMGVNLSGTGYSLVTVQGANQRGWTKTHTVDPVKVRDGLIYVIGRSGVATVREVSDNLAEQYGEIPPKDFQEAVVTLVKNGRLFAYHGTPDQQEKPDLIHGAGAALYTPQSGDVLVSPAKAAELGWVTAGRRGLTLGGKEGAEKLLPLLRRLGGIYNRGAKSTIDSMDLVDLKLPEGGSIRIQLTSVTPGSMKALGELFEVLDGVASQEEHTEAFLEILDPADDCPFIQELRNK
ncbi:ATPase AAA [Clostridiales bacterium PH28_bin88]|nr:ATPase AAA [Clostridiales bacterium PH28_bin88]